MRKTTKKVIKIISGRVYYNSEEIFNNVEIDLTEYEDYVEVPTLGSNIVGEKSLGKYYKGTIIKYNSPKQYDSNLEVNIKGINLANNKEILLKNFTLLDRIENSEYIIENSNIKISGEYIE